MTIRASDAYVPVERDLTVNRIYSFPWPAADDGAIEVYEIIDVDGTEYQYLVPVHDYFLSWGSNAPRNSLKRNGEIHFSRLHSVGTARVLIVRNTLMDQTIDMPAFTSFNGRMVEFAFDKATMICEEIAQRKCDVTTATAITQEVAYSAYDDFKAATLQFSVEKLFAILLEIDTSGEDCSDRLEDA